MVLDGEGFDTGKYLKGVSMCVEDEPAFCFLQDSVEIRDPRFFFRGFTALNQTPIASVYSFPGNLWDTLEGPRQTRFVQAVLSKVPGDDLSFQQGVMGPMLFIAGAMARHALKTFQHVPSNKEQACAMERGWAVYAQRMGYPVPALYGPFPKNAHDMDPYQAALEFNLPLIKHFPRRG